MSKDEEIRALKRKIEELEEIIQDMKWNYELLEDENKEIRRSNEELFSDNQAFYGYGGY